jgi:hypothetical protein
MSNIKLVKDALDIITGQAVSIGPAPRRSADWLRHWQELSQATYGIEREDPRFEHIMRWLNVCDAAFVFDCWLVFCEAAQEVKSAVVNGKGLSRDQNRVA